MIDYSLINDSIKFYETEGFTRIESPWTVSQKVDEITRPKDRLPFQLRHNGKCLVGSGEQSFLYLYLKGFLPKGQYQTVTPCFRFESFDEPHTKYFIKNELIKTDTVNEDELAKVLKISLTFFRTIIPDCQVKPTKIGYDIEIDGKELGSYGIRECDFLTWIYATGCAEPRTSSLRTKYGISSSRD